MLVHSMTQTQHGLYPGVNEPVYLGIDLGSTLVSAAFTCCIMLFGPTNGRPCSPLPRGAMPQPSSRVGHIMCLA